MQTESFHAKAIRSACRTAKPQREEDAERLLSLVSHHSANSKYLFNYLNLQSMSVSPPTLNRTVEQQVFFLLASPSCLKTSHVKEKKMGSEQTDLMVALRANSIA